MTESFGPYCGDRLDRDLPRARRGAADGRSPTIEVRVVDPDTGALVEAGAVGEIQIRGRNLMRGICGRVRSEVFTADGFYPTGDLGVLDADGYLFFRGRRDDMFKVKGASVYPSEVEAALRRDPRDREGVRRRRRPRPRRAGRRWRRREGGRRRRRAHPGRRLRRRTTRGGDPARLSAFKVPVRWSLIAPDEVPITATGKVDQPAIRRLLGDTGMTAVSWMILRSPNPWPNR